MTNRHFSMTRRGLLGGFGGAGLCAVWPGPVSAQRQQPVLLRAEPGFSALRAGAPDTAISTLQRIGPEPMRFKRGDELAVSFDNRLSLPAVLNWYGIGGVPGIEPLAARRPVAPGGKDEFVIPLLSAGTFMYDIRLLDGDQGGALPAQALVVAETEPVVADYDEVLLIEDWRLTPDGRALAPGSEAKDAATHYTINGKPAPQIGVRTNDRLRLRLINACQRNVIAIKIDDHDVRVMALDGQPAEPFLARNGTMVLAPGTRIDAFIDAVRPPGSVTPVTLYDGGPSRPIARLVYASDAAGREASRPIPAPLPGNGLPGQLDLRNAQRIDLPLGAPSGLPPDWTRPADFSAARTPAFQARRGRTVVLALTNRAPTPMVFHLHGHHFRLLDRLDDGWKPFWLDTLAIDAGQTQRVAFAPTFAGLWLIEATAAEWSAPRLLRSYTVA